VYTGKYFIITDGNQLNVVLMVCDAWTRCTYAFQALKFWKNLRQSTNRTLYNAFMCSRRERDYMILLRTYSCTAADGVGVLRSRVIDHYAGVCAARGVAG